MIEEVAPGILHWTALHEGIRQDVSSYALVPERAVLNPMPPPGGFDALAELVEPAAVLLTNCLHRRHSREVAERFGCPVRGPREGLHRFPRGEPVDPFGDGDEPVPGVVAHAIGALSPDEYALVVPRARAVAVADGVIRVGDGPLIFVPDQLMGDDPEEVKEGLLDAYERLLDRVEVDHLLLAHGDPVVGGAGQALRGFLDDQRARVG